MTIVVETQVPPEMNQVGDWLERLAVKEGMDAVYRALAGLLHRYPNDEKLMELSQWYDSCWWAPIEFGGIRLVRRTPEHFDFIWSLMMDTEYSSRLKNIPDDITPRDLLQILSRDATGLIPLRHGIQWVIFKDDVPIGISMFVGINFKNKSAEQILGILPGYDNSFLVGDAYCASLLFAYNALGLNRVTGNIYSDNEKTALLQERFGFRREGVLKQVAWVDAQSIYKDIILIAMLREEFETSRVLQRFIGREKRPELLMTRREWPRQPLVVSRG